MLALGIPAVSANLFAYGGCVRSCGRGSCKSSWLQTPRDCFVLLDFRAIGVITTTFIGNVLYYL